MTRNEIVIGIVDQMTLEQKYETLNYLLDKDVHYPLTVQELFLLQELMYRDSCRCKKRLQKALRKQIKNNF